MIKVGVIGAGGYTGGELLRLLAFHPKVDIAFAHEHVPLIIPLVSSYYYMCPHLLCTHVPLMTPLKKCL